MPKHHEIYNSEFSVDKLYNIITDIEKYPLFLPWCKAASIVERKKDFLIADVTVKFKSMEESYRSKVKLSPFLNGSVTIEVELIYGPFKHLNNKWVLKEMRNGTKIEFFINFSFKTLMLDKIIGLMFKHACEKMLKAFIERAKTLYG